MSAPAVPRELGFHIQQPDAVAARSYRVCQSPYNSQQFKSGDCIRIKIPTNRNAFFDPKKSYLKFVYTNPSVGAGNTNSVGISFDGYASAVIKRLQSFSGGGSVLLETVENYNTLYDLMMDFQVPTEQRATGTYAILGGSTGDHGGYVLPVGQSDQVSFGLISGVFGAQSSKLFPVGVLNDGLELHLYLDDFKNAFKTYTTGTSTLTGASVDAVAAAITITNVELVCEYVELNPNAASAIAQLNGNRYVIPNEQYRSVAVSIPQNSNGTTSLLVNHRFGSVKNLWVALQGAVGGSTILNSITGRTRSTLKSYQWRVGGINVPQKPIDVSYASGAEGFAEIERCLRGMNNVLGSCSITRDQWAVTAAGNGTGAFAIGTQLDVFDFTTDKPARSGVSTRDSPLYLDLTWSGATGEALTAYVFAHFDSEIIVSGIDGQVMELH